MSDEKPEAPPPPAVVLRIGERYVAFYSNQLLENGWEPYDQPHPAAYMPLSFAHFERYRVAGGELLVSKPEREQTGTER